MKVGYSRSSIRGFPDRDARFRCAEWQIFPLAASPSCLFFLFLPPVEVQTNRWCLMEQHLTSSIADVPRSPRRKPGRPKIDMTTRVCGHCGQKDSKQWRQGPNGPATYLLLLILKALQSLWYKIRQEAERDRLWQVQQGGSGGPSKGKNC